MSATAHQRRRREASGKGLSPESKEKKAKKKAEVKEEDTTQTTTETTPQTESDGLDELGYRELQAKAKELDLNASGKKEEIVARIRAAKNAE